MENTSFLDKLKNPVRQSVLILLFVFGSNIIISLFASAGVNFEQRLPWTIACTFILFFAIFNSLISLMSDNMDRYWTRSILSYVALAGLSGLMAWAFSSMSINEAGSYRWIYIVLTFGYLLFLSMVGFMRKIVEFAQREEWNQPRLRTKKKKR